MVKREVVLITGANSGIGLACAKLLSGKGFQVFGTTRQQKKVFQELPFTLLTLDVCSESMVSEVVSEVVDKTGRIDVLINNAGFGIAGPFEDTPIGEFKKQFEVNFYGLVRMCQAVIPIMRQQGGGLIINISSIGGVFSLPFQGAYCASKFAVEAITSAMRMELKGSGIQVTAVRPGDCSTDFTNRRIKLRPSDVYVPVLERVMGVIEKNEREGMKPEVVARVIERIVSTPSPRPYYYIGTVKEKMAILLNKFFPSRFETLLMGFYHMDAS